MECSLVSRRLTAAAVVGRGLIEPVDVVAARAKAAELREEDADSAWFQEARGAGLGGRAWNLDFLSSVPLCTDGTEPGVKAPSKESAARRAGGGTLNTQH